jgi:hypothetical protein
MDPSKQTREKLDYYEKIFTIFMAFLMLYLFNPFQQHQVVILDYPYIGIQQVKMK